MSNLKYLSLEQLYDAKKSCEKYISNLEQKAHGQKVRLSWICEYIAKKGGTHEISKLSDNYLHETTVTDRIRKAESKYKKVFLCFYIKKDK